ncbi:hypothetical protein DSECCO2_651760 [anaerobic digester metagenome]
MRCDVLRHVAKFVDSRASPHPGDLHAPGFIWQQHQTFDQGTLETFTLIIHPFIVQHSGLFIYALAVSREILLFFQIEGAHHLIRIEVI